MRRFTNRPNQGETIMISAKIYTNQDDTWQTTEMLLPPNIETTEEAQKLLEKLMHQNPQWKTIAIFSNEKFVGSIGRM